MLKVMQEVGMTLVVISFDTAVSACEQGVQWGQTLSLLKEMQDVGVMRNVISFSAAISACVKGGQ